MDVSFFLKQRTAFIRQLYDNASFSFLERKRKIEEEEEPFIPPYSEDGEPPFLSEWLEADESLHILGLSCVSMLASALHLYLKTWEDDFRIPAGEKFRAQFKKGWINGYKAYFADNFEIKWEQGPADLPLLEEIVLARNCTQHPKNITSQWIAYSATDVKKLTQPFFANDREMKLVSDLDVSEKVWLISPSIHVTKEKLYAAITQVEQFCDWLENQITLRVYRA